MINVRFPLVDDKSKNRYFRLNNTTREALKSNLLLLLLTNKGERYYNPDYGTNLLKFLFEPNDDSTLSDIENDLKGTVKTYIPELTITKVEFERTDQGDNIDETQLNLLINFTYDDNTFSENGVIEINL